MHKSIDRFNRLFQLTIDIVFRGRESGVYELSKHGYLTIDNAQGEVVDAMITVGKNLTIVAVALRGDN